MKVALVGCGHIGGSLALALKAAGVATSVVGADARPEAAARARERGIVDRVASGPAEAAAGADVAILATPVRAIAELCREVAAARVVTDVGSTKASIVAAGEAAAGGRFVGGHPMAGTEKAGPDAADGALFRGKKVILTPTARTSAEARAQVEALWRAAGAEVVIMDAVRHDRLVAAVSHLPHAVAYALAAAVGDAGGPDAAGMAGGGFTDTTRIAATPPAMWVDVFLENRAELMAMLDAYDARLAALRRAITAGDGQAIERLLLEAAAARRRILGS